MKWDGGVLKSQKKLVDYANTTNVEFIVDPGFHTGPGHIIKFLDMAKQINNFERT